MREALRGIEILRNTVSNNFSIVGPTTPCPSGLYSIEGLPTGATVTWDVTPVGIVSLTSTANSATIAKVTEGNVSITPTITLPACGSFALPAKDITTLTTSPSLDIDLNGMTLIPGSTYDINVLFDNYTDYEWTVSNATIVSGKGTKTITVRLGAAKADGRSASFSIGVRGKTACGWSNYYVMSGMVGNALSATPHPVESYVVSPNPASSIINIEATEVPQEDLIVQLYDIKTTKLIFEQNNKKGNKRSQMKVEYIKKGQYVLIIRSKKGEILKNQQILLQ